MKPTLLVFFCLFHLSVALLPFLSYTHDDVGLLPGECRDIARNCHKQKKMCLSKIYVKVMQEKCAKTCGFCVEPEHPEEIIETEEEEIEEPNVVSTEPTEAPEFPEEEEEQVTEEEEIIEEEELTEAPTTTTTLKPKQTFSKRRPAGPFYKKVCFDRMKDCAKNVHLCKNRNYSNLMKSVCAKTCGLCSKPTVSNRFGSKKAVVTKACFDRNSDCVSKIKMCRVPSYRALMTSVCRKTCGFC
uniref:ShKT domain-containing protein n=1 Tax=Steinernema glaseri TaxID=37863 RepID=A0A1I7YN02_9BILA